MTSREKIYANDCLIEQIKVERVVYSPKASTISDQRKSLGNVKNKVAVRVDNRTVIYVDPSKIENAKENWLKSREETNNKLRNQLKKYDSLNRKRNDL